MVFSGGGNHLVYSREFELDFACYFDLDLYPFDTQVCEIWVAAPSGEGLGKSVVLELGNLEVAPAENVSLAQFQVSWKNLTLLCYYYYFFFKTFHKLANF